MPSRKKFLLTITLIVLIGGILTPFLGEARNLEVRYPKIPGVAKVPTSQSTLPEYLAYLYYFAVDTVGIIAFVILVIGGIQYLTAGGSVTRAVAAKKTLIGGGTGLLLVLGAFLTLRTINPQLVGLKTTKPIPLHGICLYAHKGDPNEEEHCYVSNIPSLPEDFKPDTLEFEGLDSEVYQVFTFSKENYQGEFVQNSNARETYDDIPYSKPISPNTKSIYFDNTEAGVFLFPNEKADYDQDSFKHFPHNLPVILNSNIDDLKNFNDRTKSIQLRYSFHQWKSSLSNENGGSDTPPYPDTFFGAILHSDSNDMGQCSLIYQGGAAEYNPYTMQPIPGSGIYSRWIKKLQKVDIHPINRVRSVEIFNHEAQANIQGSVTFYEDLDYGGKSYSVPASEIQGGSEKYFWQDDFDYPWHGLNRILSIKVDGNFWVVLTNKQGFDGRCQTFTTSSKDLKSTYVLSGTVVSQPKPHSIAIIPIHLSSGD